MDKQTVSPTTKSAQARYKRKLSCNNKKHVPKRPTVSKPRADISSSTLNTQTNTSTPNSTNSSFVANHTQFSQLNQNIQHATTYGRRCVPGLNLIHKFNASMQPGPTGAQTANVANNPKSHVVPNFHNFSSSSSIFVNKTILLNHVTLINSSNSLADITPSKLNTQIHPSSRLNSSNISYVSNHNQFSQLRQNIQTPYLW